jgi:Asp/Glu/hydantoin racemase
MRLLAITPIRVSEEELIRRQARYDRLSPPGVSVRLEHLREGPHALNDAEDIAASEAALLDQFAAADPSGFDGFLPDCVLDPGQGASLPRPLFGIGRLTAYHLAGLGATYGAVARNEAIAAELDRRIATYALDLHQPTAVLDLSVEDIADDAVWADAVTGRVRDLDCDFVINACSAVDVHDQERRPVLVDPTALALRLLAQVPVAEVAGERAPRG